MTPLTAESFAADLEARFAGPFVERIEAGRLRDYLMALDGPPLALNDPVPPLFLLTLARQRRPHLAHNSARTGGVNAGDSFTFHAAAFVGDTITITCKVLGVEEKQGRNGRIFRATVEYLYHNQHGIELARRLNTLIRW